MTRLRILVVDDDPVLSEFIQNIIEIRGHEVRQAHNLSDALEAAADFNPHIAYVDLRLGEESGLELIRQYSNDFPDILCVVMTAYGDVNTAVQALRRGARDYLRKPITPSVIDSTLERCTREVTIREERKAVQKKLEASEQRFETLFHSSTQGIFVHRHFKPLYANEAILELLSVDTLEEFLALESTLFFVTKEEKEKIQRFHEERLKGGHAPTHYEMVIVNNRGEKKWVLNHSFLIDWQGEPAVCTTFSDISAIKRHEKELEKARNRAEEANRSKSKFLSSMSHELHTPMNAVLGFAQILKSDIDASGDGNQINYVNQILESGNHLLSLIDKVLLFAGVEDNAIEPHLEKIPLAELLLGSINKSQSIADRLGLRISLDTRHLIEPDVIVDGHILEKVLLALLNNAAIYNRKNGWIKVSAKTTKTGVRITVADGGLGIVKSRQGDVFTPFQRCGMENSAISGAGVGLSIAERQAELINAIISFESEEDKGSTFWLDLEITPTPS